MSEFIVPALLATWTAFGIPAIKRLFTWLGAKADSEKALAKTTVDNQIIEALEIAVSNVGTKVVDEARAKYERGMLGESDWSSVKESAKDAAIDAASEILNDNARDALYALSDKAIDELLRFVVDKREECK